MNAFPSRTFLLSLAISILLLPQTAFSQTGVSGTVPRLPGRVSLPAAQDEEEKAKTTKPRTTVPGRPALPASSPVKPGVVQPRQKTALPKTAVKPASRGFAPLPGQSSVKILAPNGNEKIRIGGVFRIKWSARNPKESADVELTRKGRPVAVIGRNVSLSSGNMNWKVETKTSTGLKPGSGYKIVLKSRTGRVLDESDRPFTLIAAGKRESLKTATPKRPVGIPQRKTAGGSRLSAGALQTSPAPTGEESSSEQAAPPQPSLTFVEPVANGRWCTNDSHEFRWNSTLPPGSNVKIDLMRGDGQTVWQSVTASTADDGSHVWPGLTDAQFISGSINLRPRIATLDNSVVVLGDSLQFGKRLVLSKPQSNYVWRKGSQYTIVWYQKCDLPSPVSVELLDNGHQPVATIASGLSSAGTSGGKTQAWTVPTDIASGTYYIRVRSAGNEFSKETAFTVDDPINIPASTAITITQPTTNSTWCTDDAHEFTWTSTLPGGTPVKIDLMHGDGQTLWRSITSSTPNDGSFTWPGLSDAQFNFLLLP